MVTEFKPLDSNSNGCVIFKKGSVTGGCDLAPISRRVHIAKYDGAKLVKPL